MAAPSPYEVFPIKLPDIFPSLLALKIVPPSPFVLELAIKSDTILTDDLSPVL